MPRSSLSLSLYMLEENTMAKSIKKEILAAIKSGRSISTLAKQYEISRSSIYRWLQDEKNKKSPKKVPKSFTSNYKLTEEEKKLIVKLKKENQNITYQEILEHLTHKVSFRTISYHLKNNNLSKKRNFKYPTLENFEKYQREELDFLKKEYQKFAKDKNHPKYREIIYSFLLIFINRGLFKEAATVAQKILKRKTKFLEKLRSKVPTIEEDLYRYLGDSLRSIGQNKRSEQYYQRLLEKVEKKYQEEDNLEFVKGLCRSLFTAQDELFVMDRIEQIFAKTNNAIIKNHILNIFGGYYFEKHNYKQAKENYQKSLQFKPMEFDEIGKTYLNLALCHKNLDEFEQAIACLKFATEYTKENTYQKAKIKLTIAIIYSTKIKFYEQSEKLYLKSISLFQEINNERHHLLSLCHLAKLYHSYHKNKKLAKIKIFIEKYLNHPELDYLARKYLEMIE